MRNDIIINLTQFFPSWVGGKLRYVKRFLKKKGDAKIVTFLEGVDHFPTKTGKSKRALVMLYPSAWLTAVEQYPNIKLYNHSGFVYGIVKALNENGFVVDLADPHYPFTLANNYDLFLGHGGSCRPFMDQLEPDTPIFQYISGLYWKVFDRESDERYNRFFQKHGAERPERHRRDISAMIEGLEYLNKRADKLFSINCPRMVAAYGEYASKFYYTGLGAYLDDKFKIPLAEKNYDEGRRNFIYVGGTSGNLQKGLDLLIEAFAQTPDLHLYIYCKVEEEILRYARNELNLPNIHYIYHWRYEPYQKKLAALLRTVNFTVHAPINIGMGTAYMATLGVGMIPVGYVDIPEDSQDCGVLTDSWVVPDLVHVIREASEKSLEWCENASLGAIELYKKHCDPDHVEERFKKMFAEVVPRS